MDEGVILPGSVDYAVSWAETVFMCATRERRRDFMRNPRRYLCSVFASCITALQVRVGREALVWGSSTQVGDSGGGLSTSREELTCGLLGEGV